MDDIQGSASYIFYQKIIEKLNATITLYNALPEMKRCREAYELLELAIYSRDAQINHLLHISMRLLKYVPHSPLMEEVFTNFMQDYLHLVNPNMPPFIGEYYLTSEIALTVPYRLASNRHPELRIVY